VHAVIGRSANGSCKVISASEHGGGKVAIKCVCEAKGEGVLDTVLRNEFELLRDLTHSSIVRARTFVECAEACGLVMELCSGTTLARFTTAQWGQGTLVEMMDERRFVMREIISAVSYLHEKRIAHRDLHSGNIMVSSPAEDRGEPRVKIVDFGSARRVADAGELGSDAASGMMFLDDVDRRILPPPQCLAREDMLTCDMFALGLLAAGLALQRQILTKHVCKGDELSLPPCSNEDLPLSSRATWFLLALLNFNPTSRISSLGALDELPAAHEWFKMSAAKLSL
jgi:serine/threonine protein kinase